MAVFSVETLKARAQNKFEDLVIQNDGTDVVFSSLLRLKPAQRKRLEVDLKKVEEIQKDDNADVDALIDVFRNILLQVASDKAGAKALLADADTPFLMVIFEAWISLTQPGEASESQD